MAHRINAAGNSERRHVVTSTIARYGLLQSAICIAVTASACLVVQESGGEDESDGNAGGTESAGLFDDPLRGIEATRSAVCAQAHECRSTVPEPSVFLQYFGGSEEECMGPALFDPPRDEIRSAVDLGSARYFSDRVEACVLAIESEGCETFWQSDNPASCQLFEGTGYGGEACGLDIECRSLNCGEDALCTGAVKPVPEPEKPKPETSLSLSTMSCAQSFGLPGMLRSRCQIDIMGLPFGGAAPEVSWTADASSTCTIVDSFPLLVTVVLDADYYADANCAGTLRVHETVSGATIEKHFSLDTSSVY